MSTFILITDYGDAIKDNILDDIVETDTDLIDKAENKAIALMKGYLNARYDVDAIFSQTGDDRNPVILMYAVDIALYLLHRRISWRDVPAWRKDRYAEAKEWLTKVNAQEINDPTLPKVTGDITRDFIRYGSNRKRNNHLDEAVSDEDEE